MIRESREAVMFGLSTTPKAMAHAKSGSSGAEGGLLIMKELSKRQRRRASAWRMGLMLQSTSQIPINQTRSHSPCSARLVQYLLTTTAAPGVIDAVQQIGSSCLPRAGRPRHALHRADAGSGRGDTGRPRRPRPDRHGPDRHRQNGRLLAADSPSTPFAARERHAGADPDANAQTGTAD